MEQIAKQLTDKWKEIIESITVRGYKRKIESVDCFKMDKYYPGYPDVICYKVVFNFEDGISNSFLTTPKESIYVEETKDKWYKELEDKFTKMFQVALLQLASDPIKRPYFDRETIFSNSKVDYMTNQGYRFIIQFYPGGFIPELRDEKLAELGII